MSKIFKIINEIKDNFHKANMGIQETSSSDIWIEARTKLEFALKFTEIDLAGIIKVAVNGDTGLTASYQKYVNELLIEAFWCVFTPSFSKKYKEIWQQPTSTWENLKEKADKYFNTEKARLNKLGSIRHFASYEKNSSYTWVETYQFLEKRATTIFPKMDCGSEQISYPTLRTQEKIMTLIPENKFKMLRMHGILNENLDLTGSKTYAELLQTLDWLDETPKIRKTNALKAIDYIPTCYRCYTKSHINAEDCPNKEISCTKCHRNHDTRACNACVKCKLLHIFPEQACDVTEEYIKQLEKQRNSRVRSVQDEPDH